MVRRVHAQSRTPRRSAAGGYTISLFSPLCCFLHQVAKRLPHLPRGVDPKNPRVIACVRRIAAEAGELCAVDSIADAKKQVLPLYVKSPRTQNTEEPAACLQLLPATFREVALTAHSYGYIEIIPRVPRPFFEPRSHRSISLPLCGRLRRQKVRTTRLTLGCSPQRLSKG